MLFYFGSYTVFVAVISTLIGLDIAVVIARLYVRRVLRQKLETDDWLILPALTLNIGMAVSVFIGLGNYALTYRYPMGEITPEVELYGKMKQSVVMKIEYAILLMSATTLTLIKLSFLFFYKRVFVYDKTNWKNGRNIVIHLLIGLMIIWGLGFVLIMFTGCRNHFYAHYSALADTMGKCINTFKYIYALAISDFITDCFIILTPIPFIWKLELSTRRKLGILLVFLLGALATVSSLIRMIWIKYIMDISDTEMPREFANPINMPFIVISTEIFWFIVEATVAMLAACLPSIWAIRRTPVAEKLLQSFNSTFSLRSGSTGSGYPRSSKEESTVRLNKSVAVNERV